MKTKTCIDTDSLKVASEDSKSYLYCNSAGCPVTLTCMFSSTSFPFQVQMWRHTSREAHSSPSLAAERLESCGWVRNGCLPVPRLPPPCRWIT